MACLSFPVQLWRFLLTPTCRPTPLKGRTGCSETALLHLRPWWTQAPLDATFHSSGWSVVHGLIHLLQPLNSLPPCFHFYISRVWADRGGSFFFFFLNDISLVGKNLWWLLHINGCKWKSLPANRDMATSWRAPRENVREAGDWCE